MSMPPTVFVARVDLPQFDIKTGDRVLYDPATSPYPAVCRDILNVGGILGAIEAGDLMAAANPQPKGVDR